MQIEPPGALEWAMLILVGALAGAVNALRSFACESKSRRLVVGAMEGATALFVTIVSFLVLHSTLPAAFGLNIPPLGLIGMSGAIAHIGLRQTIRWLMRVAEAGTTAR